MELDLNASPEDVTNFLHSQGILPKGETILRLEKPGDGNMNVVIRAVGNKQRLILKQSRPYVNKYPQIAAPQDRIDIERQFYNLAKSVDGLGVFLPGIIGYVESESLLLLEDLGEGSDFTQLYQNGQRLSSADLQAALTFLRTLHGHTFDALTITSFPDNKEMRTLNHEHIFVYPFMVDNGLNLDTITSGLAEVAQKYQADDALKARVLDLGVRYLGTGGHLLHGDYFFGSWLQTAKGFSVIDPEFCFFGPAELDLGVMAAHLDMARLSYPLDDLLASYGLSVDIQLVRSFQAIEIMRRIIGLAQLPLTLSLAEKARLLEKAYDLLMKP